MNNENLSGKNEISSSSNYSFNLNNSNFSLLFTNIGESKKLLKSYEIFINKYFETINSYFKQLTEFNYHFLVEEKFKSSVISSPIFQLGRAIKKAVQAQINNLFSIITNQKIFFSFTDALSNLSKILQESPNKFAKSSSNKNAPNEHIRPVVISLMESFAEIENKVVDDYINKKYNKRVLGLNDDLLQDKIEQAIFLERTFLDFEEGSKRQLLNDLQEMEIKTTGIFNQMKDIVKDIVNILKENNNSYLDELQREIDSIGKIPRINNVIIKNNIENNKTESQLEIKDSDNLDIFKYRIKIINHPKIQVIDKINNKKDKDNKKENEINNIKEDIKREKDNKIENNNIENDENIDKEDTIEDKEIKGKENEYKKEDKTESRDNNLENQEKIFNESELTLNEEDIYNIVSILYNYDFKMLDKSQYNLDLEKENVKLFKLSEKLLTFDGENNINEIITDDEVKILYEMLNNIDNIMKFFVMLNNYRATGRYETTERAFNIIINIFRQAEDQLLTQRNMKLEGLVIILSQTFYIMKDGKKKYLQKVIKSHPLFKKETFWSNHMNDIIDEEIIKMKNDEKNLNNKITEQNKKKKIYEIMLSKIIPISSYMNDFDLEEEIILKIINNIFEKYNIDEESKAMIISLLEKKN